MHMTRSCWLREPLHGQHTAGRPSGARLEQAACACRWPSKREIWLFSLTCSCWPSKPLLKTQFAELLAAAGQFHLDAVRRAPHCAWQPLVGQVTPCALPHAALDRVMSDICIIGTRCARWCCCWELLIQQQHAPTSQATYHTAPHGACCGSVVGAAAEQEGTWVTFQPHRGQYGKQLNGVQDSCVHMCCMLLDQLTARPLGSVPKTRLQEQGL